MPSLEDITNRVDEVVETSDDSDDEFLSDAFEELDQGASFAANMYSSKAGGAVASVCKTGYSFAAKWGWYLTSSAFVVAVPIALLNEVLKTGSEGSGGFQPSQPLGM